MTTEVLSPAPWLKFFDNNGAPAANYQLFTYAAGTSTKLVTYTDSTGGTPNTNPVRLDSKGEASIWIPPNVGYKYVFTYPTDTDPPINPIKTTDNITVAQLLTLFGGTDTGSPNAYILTFVASFTSYSQSPVIYWVPSNSNTGASTVNVNGLGVVGIYNSDGSNLGANQIIKNQIVGMIYQTNIANSGNSGFVLISVGSFTGATIGTFGTETPIASASTTDLGSATAHVVQITGTTTINSFGTSASLSAPIYIVRFTSALTLTNSTSLILPGSASIVTTAGDAAIAQYLGGGVWKVLFYQYSTGSANTKIKPADTVLTSQATLQADPDLISNTLAIGRYAYELYLIFDSVAGGAGFKFTDNGTVVDSRGSAPSLVSGFVNAAAYGPKAESPYGATIAYATVGTGANSNIVLYKGSILVGTVGTFGISWAQNASTASATTLRAGSYLTTTLLNTGSANTGLTHTYNVAGSGTETIPTGYTTLTLEVFGASGGGGLQFGSGVNESGGGGGGAGGYARSVISVAGLGGDTVAYTVGTAGGILFDGTASTAAGGTLPMSAMTGNGGIHGTSATASPSPGSGGAGGTATGGTAVNTTGATGSAGQNSGSGGNGGFGGGGTSGIYGAGRRAGNGGGTVPVASAGGDGVIIFTYA